MNSNVIIALALWPLAAFCVLVVPALVWQTVVRWRQRKLERRVKSIVFRTLAQRGRKIGGM